MTDKNSKKAINAVILKYLGCNNPTFLKKTGIVSGTLIACGIGLDLIMTGGFFSIGTFLFGGLGGFAGMVGTSATLVDNIKKSRINTAAQSFKCSSDVDNTLKKMESRLQDSFKKASSRYATQEEKERFRLLASEIGQDVKKLSPAFKIVSGGPNGLGTDKYEFMVDEKKRLTLLQALHDLRQPPAPKKPTPQEQQIKNLEARINELENPRIVRLDKNSPPPSP